MGLSNRKNKKLHKKRNSVTITDDDILSDENDQSHFHRLKHHGNRTNEDLIANKASSGNKRLRDSKRLFFTLGTLLGVLIATYFGSEHVKHNYNVENIFDNVVSFEYLKDTLDDWKNIIPQSLNSFLLDLQENYGGSFPSFSLNSESSPNLAENFAVGKQLKEELNISSKYPVVMVPGVISTGIESWGVSGDEECDSSPHFRKRLWGSFYMLKIMILDKVCWLKHLKLDPVTGLDPPHFRMRASQGFESSDFFVAGYWIWNKIIQNLGAIGYEPDKMTTVAYDWRLAYLDLERRDKYFSKVKQHIELTYALTGEKVSLVAHSMGAQVVFYFLKWVEASGPLYGNGGKGWVDKHVASFVNIAGCLLGAPKAMPALISGEMKDTVQLNALAMYGLEKFFSRRERLDMLQTWGGIPSMIPKGGNLIWGNKSFSAEDSLNQKSSPNDTYGKFIRFNSDEDDLLKQNMTMEDSISMLLDLSPQWLQDRISDQYSYGYAKTEKEMIQNEQHHSHWSNPLEVGLPNAPNMEIYCIYGINNPTERAYVYKREKDNSSLEVSIDYEAQDPVFTTEGDGTVPLISHAMCHKWAQGKSPYNPGGSKVKIVEIKHQPDRFDIRGGAKSAEHVDILGSAELNEYILKIASGNGDKIEQRIYSDIETWINEINFPL